jgi:hypothetical protein
VRVCCVLVLSLRAHQSSHDTGMHAGGSTVSPPCVDITPCVEGQWHSSVRENDEIELHVRNAIYLLNLHGADGATSPYE